ncbi:hypothetical protein ACIOHS_09840 [Streptomyces sp. NPDC088253]
MTAGNYTPIGFDDVLIVRSSDGETTLYADTAHMSLGAENTLVYPGT